MSLRSEIDKVFQEYLREINREPLRLYAKVRERLREARDHIFEVDGYTPDTTAANADSLESGYVTAMRGFYDVNLPNMIPDLLLEWWNDFGMRQKKNKERIYRAISAYWLANYYLSFGDSGTALRWLLLAHADDLLGGNENGAAHSQLITHYKMGKVDIEILNQHARGCRDITNKSAIWSQPEGFAEEIVRDFVEKDITFFTSWASPMHEFPLSSAYFEVLLDHVNLSADENKKGKALENMASYLLSLLPGCIPRPDLKDIELVGQTDVVVNNLNRVADITVDLLGRNFIVECKNWAKPIGVSQVGYFLHRMQLAHVKFGIIFSNEGITGTKPDTEKAARALIRRTYHENGSLCVVIDNTDLKSLAESERPSFWTLLLSKIEEFRFGK